MGARAGSRFLDCLLFAVFYAVRMKEFFSTYWPHLLSGFSLAASLTAMLHAVLRNRDSRAVIGWVGLIWLAPLLGPLAYLCLGINRIRRKAQDLEMDRDWVGKLPHRSTAETAKNLERVRTEFPGLLGLAALEKRLTGQDLLPGNQIQPLQDGDEAYPLMIQSIEDAQHSVALLSYIFDNDRAGQLFREALLRARDRGVEVRVLIDSVGARYTRPSMLELLKKEGIRVAGFLPTSRLGWFQYANLRNHRKILVTDGCRAFTGGTNIREGHCLRMNPAEPVQCLHFRVEGPVVTHLMEAFAVDWAFASGETLSGARWFPALDGKGAVWARGIADGPDEHFEVLQDTLIGALGAAARRVWIVTPYFLPESALMNALTVAAMRGVDVRILLPGKNNLPVVQWASEALFQYLLPKGCRLYVSPEPFDHTKLLLVDGVWSLIGSTNWDPRSLRLNFEYNLGCYDDGLALELEAIVEKKLQAAHEILEDEVDSWTLPRRLRSGLARLLMPYL